MALSVRFNNPVWSGYCADPFILQHRGVYYAYGTHYTDLIAEESHCIPLAGKHFTLLRSTDLIHWEALGGALEPSPDFVDRDHWAPEVVAALGRFWMYYSAPQKQGDDTEHRVRVAVAETPEGPFRDIAAPLLPSEEFSIDAHPFRDPRSGQWYLFFSKDYFGERPGTGIAVVPLGDDMITPLEHSRPAILPTADWQISFRYRPLYHRIFPEWYTVEGAHVVYHDSLYYCFYSGGNWKDATYGIAYAVAEHPLGPWHSPQDGPSVLQSHPSTRIGPGHNSILRAPDGETDLCVYHAWNLERTRRQLCIDPIAWTPEGPRVILSETVSVPPVPTPSHPSSKRNQ